MTTKPSSQPWKKTKAIKHKTSTIQFYNRACPRERYGVRRLFKQKTLTTPPPPPSTDDTQFIINTINIFKYILLNDTIKKLSADKYQTHNDVISNKAHAAKKTNVFCQSRYTNQSLALATNFTHSNSINSKHSYSPANPTYKSSIKSLKKSSISNHLINQNLLFSNYNFSDNTLQAVYNPPISKSPIQPSAPVAKVNYTIPNSQKVLVTTRQNPTTETHFRQQKNLYLKQYPNRRNIKQGNG